jgi:hypothetical protein
MSTATSSWSKNWAEMISARAVPDADFKNCCMQDGRFDGAERNHYF